MSGRGDSTVEIDHDRCRGHGRCYRLAPAVFVAGDDDKGIVVATGPLDAALAVPIDEGETT